MSERKILSFEVFDLSEGDDEYEMTVPEFIKWINDQAEMVPEEFRDNIRIYGRVEYGECDNHIHVTAEYKRPETDEELMHRTAYDQRKAAQAEAEQRDLYYRLKNRFG